MTLARALLFLLLSAAGLPAAALWNGVLSDTRAIDWSTLSIGADITNRATTNQNISAGASASTINTAIQNCTDNQVVYLGPGNYNLSAGLILKRNITLRGAGADQTMVKISAGTGCSFGNTADSAICVQNGETSCYGPVFSAGSAVTWSAGYSAGTTVITLASVSGLGPGKLLYLDQIDDASDGYPAAGDMVVASTAGTFSYQGGNTFKRTSRGQLLICPIVGNPSGNNVTLLHPLVGQNWRSGRTPQAWWCTANVITNVGIENMSIDFSGMAGGFGIFFFNAMNCWVTGCRIISTNVNQSTPFAYTRHVNASKITIANNYMWGPEDGDQDSGVNHYGIVAAAQSMCLIENNIIDTSPGALEINGSDIGSVWAYNTCRNSWVNSFIEHDKGSMYYLLEGNDMTGVSFDVIHGTGHFGTVFRNFLSGGVVGGNLTGDIPVWVLTYHRFYNIVGNVLGHSENNLYERNISSTISGKEIYHLGESDHTTDGTCCPAADARVKATLLRWGNWDAVWQSNRWESSEVPSGIANFSNPLPASTNLPNSFYKTSKPAFWATSYGEPAWPPIGPDVTGGNIPNTTGKANKIPSRLMYDNMPTDSDYAIQGIKRFNATNYFAGSSPIGGTSGGARTGPGKQSGRAIRSGRP